MADSVASVDAEYTRLHITPLNPALLTTVIPASILPHARNVSYHTIATFPEKSYGYVDLPVMDAEKVKKRLNGSILKGTKVRIDKARPEKEITREEEEPEKPKKPKKDPSKKRKRGDEVIAAAEIGGRSVKRGWTTPTTGKSRADMDDKKKIKSKYTTGPECLFKTVVPPNIASNIKSADLKTDRKRAKAGKEAVVHEFKKTTKYATFLRSTVNKNTKISADFVEGKGWVDKEGIVLDDSITKSKKLRKPSKKESTPPPGEAEASSDGTSSSGEPDDEEEAPGAETEVPATKALATLLHDSETSTSGSSGDSESENSTESEEELDDEVSASDTLEKEVTVSRPQSAAGPPINLSIKIPIPEIATMPISAEVHPLEALYKKNKPEADTAPKPAAPKFSFFGADADDDEEMEEAIDKVPLTPFTQRDFEHRGLRSAAPTPDTAHPNKRFIWPTKDEDEDERASSSPTHNQAKKGESSKTMATKEEGTAPENDFQKWFYENRGDTNRAWKKRRKVVAKEKRHRDNKKGQDRAV